MDMFVHNSYVSLRMPRYGKHFLGKFISSERVMYDGRKPIGEVWCRSNGWLRITGNARRIASMVRIAYRRYTLARNAEIRARMLVNAGRAVVVSATMNGPFMSMSLIECGPVVTIPERIRQLAYRWGASSASDNNAV